MPYLSSDLCNQIFSYDPTNHFLDENDDLYPENVSDEFFHGSELPHLIKEGFDYESQVLDYHFKGDELLYNGDDQAISKNDYFKCFWGENWSFVLKGSSNSSYVGEMQKLETPHTDEERTIWRDHNKDVMSDDMKYELSRRNGLKDMHLWTNCYDFCSVDSKNDLYDDYGLPF